MKLKRAKYFLTLPMVAVFSNGAAAQSPSPTPVRTGSDISREQKEQAYSKLMEGQRYLWKSNPRSPGDLRQTDALRANIRLAQTAFQKAVELDPNLAEGYTALSELALSAPPNDIEQAIGLSALATKIDANNFGGHRILARLYTYKSHFGSNAMDKTSAAKAVVEWKEVARLDPRNAEAWAFLSEFYALDGRIDDQIAALRKWIASATPLDTQFYRRAVGGRGDLSAEAASVKLGTALITTGKPLEAVTVLSEVVADNPDNATAIDLLQEAIEGAGLAASTSAINSLAPAVYSNPANIALVNLLSQVYARAGRSDEARKVLQDASDRVEGTDRPAAASYSVSLGDLFASSDKVADAIASYEKALTLRGVKEGQAVADSDREFVVQVFGKMITAYKNANRPADVKAVIERARKLLGKDDLFADRQVIAMYREGGKRPEALAATRSLRARFPNDYGLLRLEASILAESGMVDKAVALIRDLIDPKPAAFASGIGEADAPIAAVPVLYDNFTNYLFISHLYNEANRGNDAREAANQAYEAAGSEDRRQLAKLNIATSQQVAGDFAGAEATLREILRKTPGNPIALNNLGYFLLERNERLTEAVDLIQRALKIDPTNPSYLDSLGWGNFMLGNLAEAERSLLAAARFDNGSTTIQEHLGDVYHKQGKVELARSSWRRALELSTNTLDAARIRAKLQK